MNQVFVEFFRAIDRTFVSNRSIDFASMAAKLDDVRLEYSRKIVEDVALFDLESQKAVVDRLLVYAISLSEPYDRVQVLYEKLVRLEFGDPVQEWLSVAPYIGYLKSQGMHDRAKVVSSEIRGRLVEQQERITRTLEQFGPE